MKHVPVLFSETIDFLKIKVSNAVYVDCTLGGGSISRAILKKIDKTSKIIAFDVDTDAINSFLKENENDLDKLILINDNFTKLNHYLKKLKISKVDGIIVDLGYSTDQLDNDKLGLSFKKEQPLNMIYNKFVATTTAAEIINKYSEAKIANILFDYGDETYSRRIAKAICAQRQKKRIRTTSDLIRVIKIATPKQYHLKKHPAKKTFQALRIYINFELENLKKLLPIATNALKTDGRFLVITFHSLEDKIVKHYFLSLTNSINNKLPIIQIVKPEFQLINKKPVLPLAQEVERNPASRSAKLRVISRK